MHKSSKSSAATKKLLKANPTSQQRKPDVEDDDGDIQIPDIDFRRIQENVTRTTTTYDQNKRAKIRLQNETNLQLEAILCQSKGYQNRIDDDQTAFENAVWPILADSLSDTMTTKSRPNADHPVAVLELLNYDVDLDREFTEILVKSRQLAEAWTALLERASPKVDVWSLQDTLRQDSEEIVDAFKGSANNMKEDCERLLYHASMTSEEDRPLFSRMGKDK